MDQGEFCENIIRVDSAILIIKGSVISGKNLSLRFDISQNAKIKIMDSEVRYSPQDWMLNNTLIITEKESEVEFSRCIFRCEKNVEIKKHIHLILLGKISITDCKFLKGNSSSEGIWISFRQVHLIHLCTLML